MQSIEDLNKRFGAPGRIVFRDGHCGFPEVVLVNQYGAAEVALYGANVLSYRPTGHMPVIFRPSKRDYSPSDSFHGGIPICWPKFGNASEPSLPQHGFARSQLFTVRETKYTEEMTEIALAIVPNEETRKVFPYEFDFEVRISVSMKLNLRMVTKNVGEKEFAFTAGFHPYFRVGSRDAVTVRGLDGTKFVNAATMTDGELSGDFVFAKEADHVFTLPAAPKHEFAILDSSLKRAIAVVGSNHGSLVIWNPGAEGKLPDFEYDDWRKFVCVEPVTAWPKATTTLAPGEKHDFLVAIQASLEPAN